MADDVVTITRQGNGCLVVPDPFKATPGGNVTFVTQIPNVSITFDTESPFGDATEDAKFTPGKKKVKSNARLRPFQYKYKVSWPGGGQGNGSGEIIP